MAELAQCSVIYRIMRGHARLKIAVWERDRNGFDAYFSDAFLRTDAYLLRRRGGNVNDSAFNVGSPVIDFHNGTFTGLYIGYLCRRADGEGFTCRIVALRPHGRAICHLVPGETFRINRGFTDALVPA